MTLGLLALGLVLLVACAPQRQPIGAMAPTPAPTSSPTPEAPLRYGLGASLRPLNLSAEAIRQVAIVDQLTTEDAQGYDVVVSLAPQPDFVRSARPLALGFVFTQLPPLNNRRIADSLRALLPLVPLPNLTAADTAAFERAAANLRTTLLAEGLPDGIELAIAYEADLLVDALPTPLAQANVELRPFPITPQQRPAAAARQHAHLYWTALTDPAAITNWRSLLPDAEVIVIGDLWLYYKLAEGVKVVDHTAEGLPLVERR